MVDSKSGTPIFNFGLFLVDSSGLADQLSFRLIGDDNFYFQYSEMQRIYSLLYDMLQRQTDWRRSSRNRNGTIPERKLTVAVRDAASNNLDEDVCVGP